MVTVTVTVTIFGMTGDTVMTYESNGVWCFATG